MTVESSVKITQWIATTKNHLRPIRVAQSRMRAENPLHNNSAGTNNAHTVLATQRMLPLRR